MSLKRIQADNLSRIIDLGEPLPLAVNNQVKIESVGLRVLEPFTRVQLLVFTRESAGPFSCRIRGRSKQIEYTTVLGVVMPDRNDLAAEPLLRTMPVDQYADLMEMEPLRDSIRNILREIEYALTHGATLYQMQQLESQLKEMTF